MKTTIDLPTNATCTCVSVVRVRVSSLACYPELFVWDLRFPWSLSCRCCSSGLYGRTNKFVTGISSQKQNYIQFSSVHFFYFDVLTKQLQGPVTELAQGTQGTENKTVHLWSKPNKILWYATLKVAKCGNCQLTDLNRRLMLEHLLSKVLTLGLLKTSLAAN
jgi:hypothetical protein